MSQPALEDGGDEAVTLSDHNFCVTRIAGGVSIYVSREFVEVDDDLGPMTDIRLISHDAVVFARAILAAAGEPE